MPYKGLQICRRLTFGQEDNEDALQTVSIVHVSLPLRESCRPHLSSHSPLTLSATE